MLDVAVVAERLALLRRRIADAGGSGVRIIGVTKTFGPEAWTIAQTLGIDGVGENYAQEVTAKAAAVPARERPPVHFIGHLQTNKVRLVAGIVDVWQSVDRLSLVHEIVKRQPGPVILIQVNTTGEAGKFGCHPDHVADLVASARSMGCVVDGLMTMGPTDQDAARTRAAFSLLRGLADGLGLRERSMGMSGDMEYAIEAGSTMVRVGAALFGERP